MLVGYLTNSKVWGNLESFVTHRSKSACADIISSEDNLPIFTITIIKPLICVMISVWKATNR